MKTRFNSYDIVCMTFELQRLRGLRVNQIYDIDSKTYLIKFQDKDVKQTLLLESGNRFHTTLFEWPKSSTPSGFTMKLRKHLKNKRLESLTQMGSDRIIDFQFGTGDAAYHVILELFDRGNIVLCDSQMIILNVLRPHTENETVRFVVREKYPESRARTKDSSNEKIVRELLANVKSEESLKKLLTPILDCGPTVLTHVLTKHNLMDCVVRNNTEAQEVENKQEVATNKKSKQQQKNRGRQTITYFDQDKDFTSLIHALNEADELMKNLDRKNGEPGGYIIQKSELKPPTEEGGEPEEFCYNIEYHPYLFEQYRALKHKEFSLFDSAVDEFYSTLVGQKIDLKTYQQECEALKKLSNVKKDHERRLEELSKVQVLNKQRADLITRNAELVNSVLLTLRSLIANQMSWEAISECIKNAQVAGDFVARSIKQLKLETNHVSLELTDPYASLDSDSNESSDEDPNSADEGDKLPSMVVDIDLGLSAYANATRYYDQKRTAAHKEHRTIESSAKALKNAEKRTQEHLKEVRTISNISKARKVFWFEKFYWFISSENYLVIGGRDQQQNELIVKRYLRTNDIYVHADIQGASSVVIRNPFTGNLSDSQAATIPPKTLLESGAFAISFSVAWDAKVATSAYWVRSNQVSKTAPSGEYLETGSFMIRGKKNFLPPCHLILGLSLLFKLEESSIPRHANERCVRALDNTDADLKDIKTESEHLEEAKNSEADENLEIIDEDNSSSDDDAKGPEFPDTQINVSNLTQQFESDINVNKSGKPEEEDETENAIIYATAQTMPRKNRIIQKTKAKDSAKKKSKGQERKQDVDDGKTEKQTTKSGQKRGQKGKMKKIKEKYKDQDEEEKLMRMEILKSAGNKKIEPQSENKDDTVEIGNSVVAQKQKFEKKVVEQTADTEPNDDDDITGDGNDTEMLNSLTGCPTEEDELLFALPVVAPYNALQNYRYKVKITPGTNRRGKASKTALTMFLKEKSSTNQEKDLIKAIKPDAAARNMPGKIKLSAPQLQRLRQ